MKNFFCKLHINKDIKLSEFLIGGIHLVKTTQDTNKHDGRTILSTAKETTVSCEQDEKQNARETSFTDQKKITLPDI